MHGDVVIADASEAALTPLLPLAASAKVCDCTDVNVLRSFDIPSFDVCFVCVENDFQTCLEITDQLKELGAKRVYARADREIEKKFLLRNGADFVIFPEGDVAERIAINESSEQIFDYFEVANDCAICEIVARKEWIGHSVTAIRLRTKYRLSLIAVKHGDSVQPLIDPEYVFNKDDHLMVMGSLEAVKRVT